MLRNLSENSFKMSRSEEPQIKRFLVGFGEPVIELKNILLEEGVNLVGVTAVRGAGKSTLAKAICKDPQIREYFKEMVIYIEVSESPNLLIMLKIMWKNIIGRTGPDFRNVEDAHKELKSQIGSRKQPILVVLDDIRSTQDLEKLVFEEKHYKTLITTRDRKVIPDGPNTRIYWLPLLLPRDAQSLLCQYAFGKTSIPTGRDKQLVEKVLQKCNGLPLALILIGKSLYGKSEYDWKQAGILGDDWEEADKGLLGGERESLVYQLKPIIDVLKDHERECFLDVGAFPDRKAIPAKALVDIWVYARGMRSGQAKMLLHKFADRYLLELKKDSETSEVTDDSMDGYSVSQDGVMRDLALNLANQANSRRKYMPEMTNHLPSEWENLSSKAHIVSIHTGTMKDSDWPKMKFSKAKALVLYFSASEYCIPTFLHTMKNLKVLIIHNNGAKRSTLSGVAAFKELSQLKVLHLENLIVPEECKFSESLENIYMSMCEGLGRYKMFNFPELSEFNVSYCIDLEELPAGLCSSGFLKKLSVTNCHGLGKLPDKMDRFELLKKIRLFESPSLKTLPSSICSLKKLKLLDISSCINLKVKRGAGSELKKTIETISKMPSLKWVICDDENGRVFKRISGTDLKVHIVAEENPNLEWLNLDSYDY